MLPVDGSIMDKKTGGLFFIEATLLVMLQDPSALMKPLALIISLRSAYTQRPHSLLADTR